MAVCLNALGDSCSNASRGGLSATSSQAGLGIDSGTSTYLDFASAFSGAIAFSYQVAPGFAASIQAFAGLGGTGAALTGPLALFNTSPGGCPAYNAIKAGLTRPAGILRKTRPMSTSFPSICFTSRLGSHESLIATKV